MESLSTCRHVLKSSILIKSQVLHISVNRCIEEPCSTRLSRERHGKLGLTSDSEDLGLHPDVLVHFRHFSL